MYNPAVPTRRRAVATGLVFLLALASSASAQTATTLTTEAQREFLLKAPVIKSRPIGKGVTGSLRLTLSDGATTHDAAFQTIEDRTSIADQVKGRKRAGELKFADSYKYNIAAYELARVLGLGDMMPVTVERRWNRQDGSLTWWVDNVLMDEAQREKTDAQPPSPIAFQRERNRMGVFAELVGDTDRNKGNILYTKEWRVIMIDFTRAFRTEARLRVPHTLQQCERNLYTRLQGLTADDLQRVAGRHLTTEEMAAVMARRDLLVERFRRLIGERGEAAVLY
jgi:hypothetical protein